MPTSKNSNKSGQRLATPSVVLFPDISIDPAGMQALLAHFGRVMLCRPWHMDPLEMGECDKSSLEIIHPPKAMKPEKDLRRVVSDYQAWMKQNPGRGYGASLNADHTEDASWDIRQALRHVEKDDTPSKESLAFKWHLILHLADAFSQNQTDVDTLLRQMKASGSPLQEAIEDPVDLPGPLTDIPLNGTPLQVGDHRMRQIFEAWLGLFGQNLPKGDPLVTRHIQVFDYATKVFEKRGEKEILNKKEERIRTKTIREPDLPYQTFPIVNESHPQEQDPIIRGLSGKTLILVTTPPNPDTRNPTP
ncbi:MAG: hypothetical protein U5R49_18505 [Deltaproteobacteria bacterium]|nr:hypothetical protein [Deltaproteobacteria bacterium]